MANFLHIPFPIPTQSQHLESNLWLVQLRYPSHDQLFMLPAHVKDLLTCFTFHQSWHHWPRSAANIKYAAFYQNSTRVTKWGQFFTWFWDSFMTLNLIIKYQCKITQKIATKFLPLIDLHHKFLSGTLFLVTYGFSNHLKDPPLDLIKTFLN